MMHYTIHYHNIRCLIYTCVVLFSFFSCDNSDIEKEYEEMPVEDGMVIQISKDSNLHLHGIDSCISKDPINDENIEVLNRYIAKKEDKYWVKTKLGEWAYDYGLSPDMIYLTKKVVYSQFIPRKDGYVAVPFISSGSEMGFIKDNKQDKNIIGFTGGVDVTPIPGLDGNCWTIIYNIGYDMNGHKIDVDYPIPPDRLKWHYSWFKIQ